MLIGRPVICEWDLSTDFHLEEDMKALILLALAGSLATPSNPALARAKGPRIVELSVTGDGLEPSKVKVQKGEHLRLAITRHTEKTCIKKIIVKEYGIERDLPLGEEVTIDITPKKAGEIDYVCGMGMKAGTLIVQ